MTEAPAVNSFLSKIPPRLFESIAYPNMLTRWQPCPQPFYYYASEEIPQGFVSKMHSHPCLAMHGLLEGDGAIEIPGDTLPVNSNTAYIIPPDLPHGFRGAGNHRITSMLFLLDANSPGRWPADSGFPAVCQALHKLIRRPMPLDLSQDVELRQLYWQLANNVAARQSSVPIAVTTGLLCAFAGLLLERLTKVGGQEQNQPAVATQMECLLRKHVGERITVDEIARSVGLGRSRAEQIFHESFGCGILAYFNQLRYSKARQLLCDGGLTIDQIRRRLGYSSVSYFSRVFRSYAGVSPTAFRRQQANN